MKTFLLSFGLLCAICWGGLSAQTTLLAEDFNSCELPTLWSAELIGNPDAAWWVGQPTNPESDGSTIDGSCMLIFDDDLTGDGTAPWNVTITSPPFDATQHTNIWLSMDVNFRNAENEASLQIQVYDGVQYQTIKEFKTGASDTGEEFSHFTTFVSDLSFYANPEMRIRFRYDDGNVWAWWAGIDNILVNGQGTAINILTETFNDCSTAEGWSTQVLNGENDWQFGFVGNANAYAANSMNGSCFAYFDDDGLGENAPPSAAMLISPVIDGTLAARMYLDFDIVFRRYEDEAFIVAVYDVEADEVIGVETYLNDLGGPQFNEVVHQRLDISAQRRKSMRLVFFYTDGNSWGWWLGLDNIRLSGEGSLNEVCTAALPVEVDGDCIEGDNTLALFDGLNSDCSSTTQGGLWYTFVPSQSGVVRIKSTADFNDVLDVFTGSCTNLSAIHCDNRDEHGFTGEESYITVSSGTPYYLRISGHESDFGRLRGNFCLQLEMVQSIPEGPAYQACNQAIGLEIDGACQDANTFWANYPDPLPSRDILARSGIWFSFTPISSVPLVVRTEADFAEVITAFTGECGNLTELAINEFGEFLPLQEVVAGQTIYVQIAGVFATVEGNLCVNVATVDTQIPDNNICTEATLIPLGNNCTFADNTGASFTGPEVSCDPYLDHSIWFRFVAPASGTVQLRPDADFRHAMSVYQGDCSGLEEIACYQNPLYCEGPLTLGSLSPNLSYYVRISSSSLQDGFSETGSICLSIEDVQAASDFMPLSVNVSLDCFDNGSAVLDLLVSGGDGNYTFVGPDETTLYQSGESYLVIVSDGRGCEVTASGTVACETVSDCQLQTTVETTPASCPDMPDGTAQVQVSGQQGTVSYAWSTGDHESVLTGLLPGSYTVTITDQSGCEVALQVEVPAPEAVTLLAVETMDQMEDGTAGSIQVSLTGGTTPYGYLWTKDGATVGFTPTLNDLPAGEYELKVTDANGCVFFFGPITVNFLVDAIEPLAEGHIRIAPSVTDGPIRLDWKLPSEQNLELVLSTISGRQRRIAQDLPAEVAAYTIDLSQQPAGVYLLRWSDGLQEWSRRVVVTK